MDNLKNIGQKVAMEEEKNNKLDVKEEAQVDENKDDHYINILTQEKKTPIKVKKEKVIKTFKDLSCKNTEKTPLKSSTSTQRKIDIFLSEKKTLPQGQISEITYEKRILKVKNKGSS